jgi:VIT1/CCC1 family predicted Fe2+/Mn2+ transporter
MRIPHREHHYTGRIGVLRAAVLGANDGIVSTASLVVGIAASEASRSAVLLAGVAGLVAGALSMAAGEYVSVSSQADTERADVARETRELAADPAGEERELTSIYVERGLDPELANAVAKQLMARDALKAHTRDELGLTEDMAARPLQAAVASAATFSAGAILPVLTAALTPTTAVLVAVTAVSLVSLGILGAVAARAGGASVAVGTTRVVFWGALAMAVTAGVGRLDRAAPARSRPSPPPPGRCCATPTRACRSRCRRTGAARSSSRRVPAGTASGPSRRERPRG